MVEEILMLAGVKKKCYDSYCYTNFKHEINDIRSPFHL